MIVIASKKGKYYVKVPALESMEIALHKELIEKYCDMKNRAISVELDPDNHHEKSITIICDEIFEIARI